MGKVMQKSALSQGVAGKFSQDFSARIRQLAQYQGLRTIAEIAEICTFKRRTLYEKMAHGGPWTLEDLEKLCRGLGVTLSDLLPDAFRTAEAEAPYDSPYSEPPVLPLVGRAAADRSQGSLTEFEHPNELYPLTRARALVEIVDDCLAPIALAGQHVIVDGPQRTARSGDLVVLETTDGHTYAKRLHITEDSYILTSVNYLAWEPPVIVKKEKTREVRVITGVYFE